MKEIVSVIRSEILILKEILEKIAALKEAIKLADDAKEVKTLAKETEGLLSKLSETADLKENFLTEHNENSIEEYLEAQRLSETREVVMRLFRQAKESETELAKEISITKELLKRSSAFVDFRMNVIAGVKADATYGSPAQNQGNIATKKMFDANV